MTENRRVALIAIAILLILAGGLYFYLHPKLFSGEAPAPAVSDEMNDFSLPAVPDEDVVEQAGEPEPERYPLPATAQADVASLPELADSDKPLMSQLADLMDAAQLNAMLYSERLIRRLVVTVDNLPREHVGMKDRAFKRVPGMFMVRSRDGSYTLNPHNEQRYVPMVMLARAAGAGNVAKLYLRYYPLFDQAYRELGYPNRHFNDRLIQVIDHLLATPDTEDVIELVQPKVFYQFADPALESRSAGQKMLIRMGPVNRAHVKEWLKSFRAEISGVAQQAN
jgi:hypothetical protein